ncbi:hypothetical protein MHB84_16340 [Paenibacillus sp. FSL F4-0087]|uniref:hypothetical protein n=1 Tax=Paenibacillus sp. FSL F4-0087 TaxID=2921368 RepID=UPI00096EC543|nr:hypothetical protein BK122_03330 [Paenibacillus pabuli]
MTTRTKIAYLMHVDWNWIKQRPHFLFEELTRYYNVDLFYIYKFSDKHRNTILNSRTISTYSNINLIRKVPMSGRVKTIQWIERFINRNVIRSYENFDYIWITSPIILDFVPLDRFKDKLVIYDCMDDFLGFYDDSNKRINRLRLLEIELVRRADFIFTSSNYLKNKIVSSYKEHLRSIPVVINNGISPSIINSTKLTTIQGNSLHAQEEQQRGIFNITYIGTVGAWFDFDTVLYVLDQMSKVKFTIVGPIDTKVPVHPRLEFIGMVEHEKLKDYADKADAFIMPFVLSELVRAVDPVKIYEYILFCKPIFSINYGEMHKFLPYVHLYSHREELIKLINDLINSNIEMHSKEESIQFSLGNTWRARCRQIVDAIEGV